MKYWDAVESIVSFASIPDGFNGGVAVVGLTEDRFGQAWVVGQFGCYRDARYNGKLPSKGPENNWVLVENKTGTVIDVLGFASEVLDVDYSKFHVLNNTKVGK